ncbi:MAG: NGG1p interacting factor NIF3 [Candidatus Omnitrophota bacterium]|jgi:putative NIF3 family GTP cyclohydrolase 1 type 2|nr:MAG: NGG1p interacting factor NIF3 [Candidatus Omnitrophota bacterium]
MKLSQLFSQIIKFGIDKDPRIKKPQDGKYFPDSAILNGDPDLDIRKIMVGIDIEGPELILADKLREQQGLDLVISHHPEGAAYASLHQVMKLQADVLNKMGLKFDLARKLLDERMREVERRVMSQNHMRSVDIAKLLNLAFICVHTPADNHVYSFMNQYLREAKPKKVKDIVGLLMQLPEYSQAADNFCGPKIILGNPNRPVGKVLVEMTGGTEGPKETYDKLYKCGVRTLVSMHLSEEHFKKVKDVNLNVVIAGHISSDTLGLNLLLDRLEKKEKFQFIDCSGFRRIRR